MTRTSIQQFRASLVDGADQTAATRAYRQIARRPAPDGRVGADWAVWPPAAAAASDRIPWGAASTSGGWAEWPGDPAAASRLAAWGDWTAPPAHAAA